jgi:hypothetical protein
VRSEEEYFDEIQDVKVAKDMLDLAKHIVNQKSGRFKPDEFEEQYETAHRSHQQKARRQADYAEGAAARRERGRPDGRAAQEHRRGRGGKELQAGQEATQDHKRSERNAHADRRQKTGKGSCCQEAGGRAAAEVSLGLLPVKSPKMTFCVLIIGGTGQVGAAVVRALAAESSCAEVVMVNRRAISPTAGPRVRQVILNTAAAQYPAEVTKLAQSMVAQGDPVYGASCVGVGKGSNKWSEEELKALEIGVVGGFARGCQAGGITRFSLLSAVGSNAKSRIRYVRVMGLKEETVREVGFKRLAIFRPGIIAGNAHTPGYVACWGV